MSITFNALLHHLLAPLHGWFETPARLAPAGPNPIRVAPQASPQRSHAPLRTGRGNSTALSHRPLRVVRVLDASASHPACGRMVISGRMSDVCAELDRLAALHPSLS